MRQETIQILGRVKVRHSGSLGQEEIQEILSKLKELGGNVTRFPLDDDTIVEIGFDPNQQINTS